MGIYIYIYIYQSKVQEANWEECFVWGCIGLSLSTIALMLLSGMVFSAALKQHNLGYQELIQQHPPGGVGGISIQSDLNIPGSPGQSKQVYKTVDQELLFQ